LLEFGPTDDIDLSSSVHKFLTEFELKFGTIHPQFLSMSFQQACQKAKSDHKFLLVYLHSPLHHDTQKFCRETLCTELISEFLSENFLIWGGNITYSEPYKASIILGASSYPFLTIICNNNVGGMTILDKIEGPILPEDLMLRLSVVLETHGPMLTAARIEVEEREQNRRIREEQDVAFQQSLLEDQEKQEKVVEEERKKKEEFEVQQKQDQLRQTKQKELEQRRERISKSLAPEPEPGDGVTQLIIRLTDGSRLQRRFYIKDRLQTVMDFVDSKRPTNVECPVYDLVSNFPRKTFTDHLVTLEEAGLHPQASLFVQEH